MSEHRIKILRERAGMTQEELGARIGRSKSVVSRIEDGQTKLDLDMARKIASALGVTLPELLGIELAATAHPGLEDGTKPYEPSPHDRLPGLAGNHLELHTVTSRVLSAMGIELGDVVVLDTSEAAINSVRPLQAVQVIYTPPSDMEPPVTLLRQFVPPRLLITNSAEENRPSLDLEHDEVAIVAVVSTLHRKLT